MNHSRLAVATLALLSGCCAWKASTTPLEDFNLRVGAVIFAESGDHFGQAVNLLARTSCLATRSEGT